MSPFFLDQPFNQFCQERQYIKNSAANTIIFYRQSYKAFKLYVGEDTQELNKSVLNRFVLTMREKGLKPSTCNVYIRGLNSFLSWLHEYEFITEPLKIKLLKTEQRVMKTFSDQQLKAIVSFKPKTFTEFRIHTLLCLLIDTGVRVTEALELEREKIDFDNLFLTVRGKGNKERFIPMSLELRKTLWKFCQQHSHSLVFPNRDGGKLLYDNTRRDFRILCHRLKIEGFDGSFHAFRRKFAKSYVRNGGNLFYLMKALGHTTLTMSKKYVEVETDELKETHIKTSLLSRLK
ncbi:MAG TPA: tyrosine-type recombinase/integrase [Pyrinomonadaceae bacterium]|nr:tyrosine-type recombinase/integrase [Pyrinomonadaceae bacterium]